jgi:hypothetical protein
MKIGTKRNHSRRKYIALPHKKSRVGDKVCQNREMQNNNKKRSLKKYACGLRLCSV